MNRRYSNDSREYKLIVIVLVKQYFSVYPKIIYKQNYVDIIYCSAYCMNY